MWPARCGAAWHALSIAIVTQHATFQIHLQQELEDIFAQLDAEAAADAAAAEAGAAAAEASVAAAPAAGSSGEGRQE